MKNKKDMVKWLNNLKSDIGQPQHSQLWHYVEILDVIAKYLESTERPKGKWIDKGWHGDWQFETDGRGNCWVEYECSECGFHNKGSKSDFCPNCGADMRGEDK